MTQKTYSTPAASSRHRLANLFFATFGLAAASAVLIIRNSAGSDADQAALQAILAVGGLVFALFCAARIRAAIFLLLLIAPYTGDVMGGIPFHLTPGDAALLILVAAWAVRVMALHEENLRRTPLDWIIGLFVASTFFSLIASYNMQRGVKEFVQTIEHYVFAFYFFFNNIKGRDMLRRILYALCLASVGCTVYAFYEYVFIGNMAIRPNSFFGNTNAYGCFLALIMPIAFNMALFEKRPRVRRLLVVVLALDMGGLLLTLSRGAWVGLAAGIAAVGALRGMTQFARVFAIAGALLLALAWFGPNEFEGRALSVADTKDEAIASRMFQYQIARDIMLTRPFGVGLENIPYYARQKLRIELGDIHNMFLHIGAERGVFAMLALLTMFYVFFRNGLAYIKRCEDPFLKSTMVGSYAAATAFVTVNLTAYQMVRGVAIYFFCVMALMYAANAIWLGDPQSEAAANEPGFPPGGMPNAAP